MIFHSCEKSEPLDPKQFILAQVKMMNEKFKHFEGRKLRIVLKNSSHLVEEFGGFTYKQNQTTKEYKLGFLSYTQNGAIFVPWHDEAHLVEAIY